MDTSVREVTTSATLAEKKKLRKEFKIFDMIFIVVAGIIGLDTLGAVSSNGGQALTWLFISAITFFLPMVCSARNSAQPFPRKVVSTSGAKWRVGAILQPWLLCSTGSPTRCGSVEHWRSRPSVPSPYSSSVI